MASMSWSWSGQFLKLIDNFGGETEMFLERFELVEEIGENLDD